MMRQTHSLSAVYMRPDGRVTADWIAYDTLGAALLGPASNRYVGARLGYVVRPHCGPPMPVGFLPSQTVDLRR